MKKQGKVEWQLRLLVEEPTRAGLTREAQVRGVTQPALLSALLDGVFSRKQLLEELLAEAKLRKKYARYNSKAVDVGPETSSGARFDTSSSVRVVGPVESQSGVKKNATHLTAREILAKVQGAKPDARVLVKKTTDSPAVIDLKKVQAAKRQSEPPPKLPSNVVVLSNFDGRRSTSLGELCEMITLPGENSDAECDAARERWEERWGDPTEEEEGLLTKARDRRFEVFASWRAQYRVLVQREEREQRLLDAASTVREHRTHLRRLHAVQSELRVFCVRTRWKERNLDQTPENA